MLIPAAGRTDTMPSSQTVKLISLYFNECKYGVYDTYTVEQEIFAT